MGKPKLSTRIRRINDKLEVIEGDLWEDDFDFCSELVRLIVYLLDVIGNEVEKLEREGE